MNWIEFAKKYRIENPLEFYYDLHRIEAETLPKEAAAVPVIPNELKVGDTVKIAKTSRFYSEYDKCNPTINGRIENIDKDQIEVLWGNGMHNNYNPTDLVKLTVPDKKLKHLRYDIMAGIKSNENRHPQDVMKALGISYQYAVPQSIADQWWFFNCENVPSLLPSYLTELNIDPIKCIGHGLSVDMALEIIKRSLKQ
jgi:hypothetical protein